MSLTRRRFITICAGVAGLGMVPARANDHIASWRGTALGAEARLVITGLPRHEGERLISQARAEINRLENIFSLYRAKSAVSILNKRGQLSAPPGELLSLFSIVSSIHSATGELFDPTVQPLWDAYARAKGKPTHDAIAHAKSLIDWQNVHYDATRVHFGKSDMQITLNGIAQGFVTDRITALLEGQGLQNGIVNIGEISALGEDPSGAPWPVGLATLGDGSPSDTIALSNESVATSAPLGTTFDGHTSHILSPLNVLPVKSIWQKVSVVHQSAAVADGLSTAAILMDAQQLTRSIETFEGARVSAQYSDGKRFELNL